MISGSYGVPSAYTEQRPVAVSQVPLCTMHGKFGVAEHPTVKQSPSVMPSTAKFPVKSDPDVYLVRGERMHFSW